MCLPITQRNDVIHVYQSKASFAALLGYMTNSERSVPVKQQTYLVFRLGP